MDDPRTRLDARALIAIACVGLLALAAAPAEAAPLRGDFTIYLGDNRCHVSYEIGTDPLEEPPQFHAACT